MSTKQILSKLGVLALACVPFAVSADGAPEFVVYDRERGELSPGTEAPSAASMLTAIDKASPQGLTAMLEYGERVECLACIPKLQAKLLDSSSAETREIAAWWLRRRPFGYARAAVAMRQALDNDDDDVRRARAAEALGEFLDAGGVPVLEQAVLEDGSPDVRIAAVRALGRMNARAGHAAIAAAFDDEEPSIRRAALDQVLRVSFFSERAAVIPKLEDSSADVRVRAAQIIGQLQLQAGREALEDALAADDSVPVRQAAAWALGRLGGARDALIAAQDSDSEPRVLDAVRVALAMVR
jgi:HEAT repeat protein